MLVHPAAHNAATADADLFQPTVGIRVALHRNFSAVNLGVSLEVWRAAALGRVADGLAVRVDATDAGTAGILAQPVVAFQEEVAVAVRTAPSNTSGVVANLAPVAVVVGGAEVARRALTMNAYVPWQALFVRNTVRVLLAFKLRVPIEAGRAEAVRAMVLWRTVSVDSAGTAEGTRVLALALVTALVDGAVLVSTATVKATVCFADFAERTLVVSCAFHFGYATSIVTRPLCTAVKFPAADIRIPQALRIGVTQRLRRTCTGQSVVESLAVGVQATSPDKLTGVLALTTDARLVVWAADIRTTSLYAPVVLADLSYPAVRVYDALHLGALHVGVSRVTRATRAVGTMVNWLALSIRSAGSRAGTGVDALTIDAGVSRGTVKI